jgi:hypothetical protein
MENKKIFNKEIIILFERLKSRKPFSFSKFADGEWFMIRNMPINNNEFNYTKEDEFYRNKLIDSFKFKDDGYYVGISCPCCQGIEHSNMLNFSEQAIENLTFANIFVNSNYAFYLDNFINEYKNWDIHLIANKNSKIDNLPFKVEKFYPVENTAWKKNYQLIEEIKLNDYNNKLFLFACGPFGNMLAHQLWETNKKNTYLDIGSTLNPWLQSEGFKRDYYTGNSFYKDRICVWGQ